MELLGATRTCVARPVSAPVGRLLLVAPSLQHQPESLAFSRFLVSLSKLRNTKILVARRSSTLLGRFFAK